MTAMTSHEDARKVSGALQDLLRGIGREAGLHRLAPAADAEVPPPPSGGRCLITRAALDALAAPGGERIPGVTVLHAAQYTMTGFGAWVEWLESVTPVALAAFRDDSEVLTIALWAEVREQILHAVAAYDETMADWDWQQESI